MAEDSSAKPNTVDRIVGVPVNFGKSIGSNAGSIIRDILILLLIACVVYLSFPIFRNYGPTVLLGNLKLGGFAIMAGVSHFYQLVNCAMTQECVTAGPATDIGPKTLNCLDAGHHSVWQENRRFPAQRQDAERARGRAGQSRFK